MWPLLKLLPLHSNSEVYQLLERARVPGVKDRQDKGTCGRRTGSPGFPHPGRGVHRGTV